MALGIHALNISRIVALLISVHGTARGASTDYAAASQTGAGPNGGPAASADCSAGSRAQRSADYRASHSALHSCLIRCRAANLE